MNKEILRLAIPNIISNISVPLLSTVDTALMGRISELHIGAVGVGAMIFNFIYWNFGFLRMGTTGLTAQSYGSNDPNGMSNTMGRAMLIAAVLAVLILTVQVPFGHLSFQLMGVTDVQRDLVANYFFVRVWAAPATFGLYALMGWFFGMQNAIYPLVLTIFINVVNIVMNLIFVRHYGMGVEGVAWGTVIAQYSGILMGLFLLWSRYEAFVRRLRLQLIVQWDELKKFMRVNRDIFIRTLFLTFAFAFFYAQSVGQGEMVLAVNVILLQFVNWMSFGIDGFAYASESLVGKYAGARDDLRTKKAIGLSFVWSFALVAVYALIYGLLRDPLLSVFTNQSDVAQASHPYYWWVIALPLIAFASYIWDGIYVGLTASRSMRNSMAYSFVIYLALYFAFFPAIDNHGLWLALTGFLLARGLIQTWMYYRKGLELS